MTYADNPALLAHLLRDLADIIEAQNTGTSESGREHRLIDEARQAAKELDLPERRRPGKFAAF
ncbi:hypothetical protein [Streptomyces sp. 35G-GA-8]|uniref:hypothetical protein n=1 Tax=Streptomyces sp. 35G-GA-8 TaxID=2939434 RepID=UPI00201EAA4F|nr:hypothetical protein [Streptomyces sp. 35G-GA-8]MCL7377447.1 hypothetical protein [Streptomyces sp. 35G-GA-8]